MSKKRFAPHIKIIPKRNKHGIQGYDVVIELYFGGSWNIAHSNWWWRYKKDAKKFAIKAEQALQEPTP